MVLVAVMTPNLAEAVPPVPPSVDVTVPLVLTFVPAVESVTFIVMMHEPLARIEPPARVIEFAVLLTVPPHCGVAGIAARVIPVGKLSVKPTPVKPALVFGLVSVNVSVEVPPGAIGFGEKDLMIVGGATTVTLAEAVFPVPPFAEATLPVVLFLSPAVTPVTVTLNAQLAPAVSEPPLK